MTGTENLFERFRVASETLVGSGSLQGRLESALISILVFRVEDFPPDLAERFSALWELVSAAGSARASIDAMSDEGRQRMANDILSMFIKIVERTRRA